MFDFIIKNSKDLIRKFNVVGSATSAIASIVALLVTIIGNFQVLFEAFDLISIAALICVALCIRITISVAPTRITVIAGVAMGIVAAMLFVEGAVALNEHMSSRLDETG